MQDQESIKQVEPDDSLNWADYVDALMRQDSRRNVLVSRPIKGRRLRDGYHDEVRLSRLVHPLLRED